MKTNNVIEVLQKNTQQERASNNILRAFGVNNNIQKANEDDLEKAGEGSKGGKIVGHDKNGHPIYEKKTASLKDEYAHHSAYAAYHSQSRYGSKDLRDKHLEAMDKIGSNLSERDKQEAYKDPNKVQPSYDKKIDKFVPFKTQ